MREAEPRRLCAHACVCVCVCLLTSVKAGGVTGVSGVSEP